MHRKNFNSYNQAWRKFETNFPSVTNLSTHARKPQLIIKMVVRVNENEQNVFEKSNIGQITKTRKSFENYFLQENTQKWLDQGEARSWARTQGRILQQFLVKINCISIGY